MEKWKNKSLPAAQNPNMGGAPSKARRWQRILILGLLSLTVCAPIVFFSSSLTSVPSAERREFINDIATIKYKTDDFKLKAIQEEGEHLKGPKPILYKDGNSSSVLSYSSSDESHSSKSSENESDAVMTLGSNGTNHESREEILTIEEKANLLSDDKVPDKEISKHDKKLEAQQRKGGGERNMRSQPNRATDEKVKEIRDQLIQAKAYLNFAPPGSNSHFVKELKLRIKELERAAGGATKDVELSRSALHKMKPMEATLSRARRIYPDCSAMAIKLRAMAYSAEEQVRVQRNQATFLSQLAARTTPKGVHCLSMRLTHDYFALEPDKRQLPNQQKLHDPNLYHYAVFSDNVLACVVVVNSTVSSAREPEKLVFHVVTDSLNFPAISMWFLLNPPGKATIHIQSMDNLNWPTPEYSLFLTQQRYRDPRFNSPLNYLRFYLPDIFPELNKIVLFDHDVVVQRDLSSLWKVNMRGKVVGAVETCQQHQVSFRRMDMFINFADNWIAKRFDPKTCTWAFGMNLFNLKEWRKQNLTSFYHKYLKLGYKRPLWKAGSLPLGWVTFYNQMVPLDNRWHILGLGYDSGIARSDIERAPVIHFDGVMKPWLEIGIAKYKSYWTKFVPYDHPHLQRCNIHE